MAEPALPSICVFCGSSPGASPAYTAAAARLGGHLARTGRRLIYGGGRVGLMGTLADAALAAGGTVVGWADLTLHNPRAFIWDQVHGMRDLNDLVQAPPNFILDWAIKINDGGWIVGVGHFGPGWDTSRGFVLAPIPLTTAAGDPGAAATPALAILENPVRSQLTIEFTLPAAGSTRVSVLDVAGRTVARIADQTFSAGRHRIFSPAGTSQPRGIYYVRLEGPGFAATRPFVLLK